MKYTCLNQRIPHDKRKTINEKVLYLIESGMANASGITCEDIFNAYTGDGGLHGLNREDYDNYHTFSEAKKEIEQGQFFTPAQICELIISCLRLSASDVVADLT